MRQAGFEPATRCLEGSRSIRLSYWRSVTIVHAEGHTSATLRSQSARVAVLANIPKARESCRPPDYAPSRSGAPALKSLRTDRKCQIPRAAAAPGRARLPRKATAGPVRRKWHDGKYAPE